MWKIRFAVALLLAGTFCLSKADAWWQSRDSNYNVSASSGCSATLAVTSYGNNSAAVPTTTVPTINAGDLVVWLHSGYAYATGGLYAISSPNLGTFTSYYDPATNSIGAVFWAKNTGGTLTNEVITTTESSARSTTAISISGANTTSPFDSAGVTGIAVSTSAGVSITTANANDMVIAEEANGGTADSSPWVSVGGNAYGNIGEYKIVSSTGTYTATWGGVTGQSEFIFGVKRSC